MKHSTRSRTLIVTAAALTFVFAGSAVAFADTGDASDHPDETDRVTHRTDRHRDRPDDRGGDPVDRPVDRPTDRPRNRITDGPIGPPIPVDPPTDRTGDRPDRDDHPSIWRRCLQAAQSDEIGDTTSEFRKICRRVLWRHNAWKRCVNWASEHTDLDIENRRAMWELCHRLLWNHRHAE